MFLANRLIREIVRVKKACFQISKRGFLWSNTKQLSDFNGRG